MTPDPGQGRLTRCAVLGSPIAHSLSPVLHTAAYVWLGLPNWRYDAVSVSTDGLAEFVAGLDAGWRGLSLTMPLKKLAMNLGAPDDAARLSGVANTVVLDTAGPRVANTDVPGLVWALRRGGVEAVESAVVLGAGATGRSALVSVARLGARRITVMARRPEVATELVALGVGLGIEVTVRSWGDAVPPSDLLLATAASGAADARAAAYVESAPVIFDAIYDPWPTVLAASAQDAGRTVVSGLDLLVGQALLQLELMTGRSVPPEVLYDAGRAELATRSRPDPPLDP